MSKTNRMSNKTVSFLLILGILIGINIISYQFYYIVDFTEDNRYTLTDYSHDYIDSLDEEIFVKLWLGGSLPSGFLRLQQETEKLLKNLNRINPNVTYDISDPNEGSVEKINQIRQELIKDGMKPITLRIEEGGERVDKIIYPYVQIYKGNSYRTVSLLEGGSGRLQNEETLNNAIALIEYKIVHAIKAISSLNEPIVLFTKGHGEAQQEEIADLLQSMHSFYRVGNIDLDSVAYVNDAVSLLIIADPQISFNEKEKFKIDQYLMRGGRILWVMDKLDVTIDSIAKHQFYVPRDMPTNLDNQLFTYGIRIQPNLVLDLECSPIPLKTGDANGQAQFDLFDWYYHVAATPTTYHPIVKNLDRINLFFPSSIDTIQTDGKVNKVSLLKSSEYSRYQFNPVRLNFEILRYEPDKDKFNEGPMNLAVLYEGQFPSHYKDRVTPGLLDGLNQMNRPYIDESTATRMIAISDGDMIRNKLDPKNGNILPLGYNEFDRYLYDNKNFILNCIDYLVDDGGIVSSRTKRYKLRLMDKNRIDQEMSYWQMINFAVPLFILFASVLIFQWVRRRRFAN